MQSITELKDKTTKRIENWEKLPEDWMEYITKFVKYWNEHSQELIVELNKTSLSVDEKQAELIKKTDEIIPMISKAIDIIFNLWAIENWSKDIIKEDQVEELQTLIQDCEDIKEKQKNELEELITL